MTTAIPGWDATHADLPGAPPGQGAGYTTGSSDIAWTEQDWADHPGAVRICQDADGSDATADVIDDEPGADTDSGSVGWYKRALADWTAGRRPGQRHPAFYRDLSGLAELTPVISASDLVKPVPLWLADWNLTMEQAAALIGTVSGDFVHVGVQFANRGHYDSDYFDQDWLDTITPGTPPPPPPPVPTFTEVIMQQLPTIQSGDQGQAVRTAQGLLVARGYHLGTTGALKDGIDGDYGPLTDAAVRDAQLAAHITDDGIVGPLTWPVLAGV